MSNSSPAPDAPTGAPPPTATQYSVDWNNVALQAIAFGLNQVPVVGGILSALIYAFWPPSGQDVWDEIKQNVEALVEQKFDTTVFDTVQGKLGAIDQNTGSGLAGDMNNYLCALNPKSPNYNGMDPARMWGVAEGSFTTDQPDFQTTGYELLLLPLFAQFANMHLSLLRDGVERGWVEVSVLHTKIGEYTSWADEWYGKGLTARAGANKGFNYVNDYMQGMQVSVMRFRETWPYFDPTTCPPPVKVSFTNQTYFTISSQLNYPGGEYQLPSSTPDGPLTNIDVYWLQDLCDSYNLVLGTQSSYGAAQEPYYGVLINNAVPPAGTPCDPNNDSACYFKQGVGVSPDNPIVGAQGVYDNSSGTYCVDFVFQNGSSTGQIPGQSNQSSYVTPYNIAPPKGYYLSSVWSPSTVGYYMSAYDVVFGFRYQPPDLDEATARAFYVSSPQPVSTDDPALAPFAATAASEDWEAQRQEFLLRLKQASAPPPPAPPTAGD